MMIFYSVRNVSLIEVTGVKHRKCGGKIFEDWEHAYIVPMTVGAEIITTTMPRFMCSKCGVEILNDKDIVVKPKRATTKKLSSVLSSMRKGFKGRAETLHGAGRRKVSGPRCMNYIPSGALS
jgi:hypothetical protein